MTVGAQDGFWCTTSEILTVGVRGCPWGRGTQGDTSPDQLRGVERRALLWLLCRLSGMAVGFT